MRRVCSFLGRNAWIFVVLAFLLVIGAWSAFYLVASKVPQRRVPLDPPAPHATP
ncbi:MAG: hypothetical protein MUF04_11000 [Akkermansiaceae bacterium]|jgi:hypothetical protein|nr:hypothetical protein [Akkermansiaceae bacterium]